MQETPTALPRAAKVTLAVLSPVTIVPLAKVEGKRFVRTMQHLVKKNGTGGVSPGSQAAARQTTCALRTTKGRVGDSCSHPMLLEPRLARRPRAMHQVLAHHGLVSYMTPPPPPPPSRRGAAGARTLSIQYPGPWWICIASPQPPKPGPPRRPCCVH